MTFTQGKHRHCWLGVPLLIGAELSDVSLISGGLSTCFNFPPNDHPCWYRVKNLSQPQTPACVRATFRLNEIPNLCGHCENQSKSYLFMLKQFLIG